jgi:acetolactate synthase-1/3 small subunit
MSHANVKENRNLALHARAFHRPGVLARMTGMFYRRALNIRSLTVGEQDAQGLVDVAVRVEGEPAEIERLALAIRNMIDVVHAEVVGAHPLTASPRAGYESGEDDSRRSP